MPRQPGLLEIERSKQSALELAISLLQLATSAQPEPQRSRRELNGVEPPPGKQGWRRIEGRNSITISAKAVLPLNGRVKYRLPCRSRLREKRMGNGSETTAGDRLNTTRL